MRVQMKIERIGDCTLYLADCTVLVNQVPKDAALVTDPPYGINESSKKVASRGKLAKPKDYGDFNWDKTAPQDLINLYRARTKNQIIWGGNYFDLPPTSCYLVWDKQNGANDFADCELAYTNLKMAVRIFRWRWNGMIRRGNEEREHPTQKPLELMKWCIGRLPEPSSVILDPFMGSGTTGVACAKMGRKFIGIEKDARYFDIACERISDAYKQPDLFVPQPIAI
jgi:DNA modification methylase